MKKKLNATHPFVSLIGTLLFRRYDRWQSRLSLKEKKNESIVAQQLRNCVSTTKRPKEALLGFNLMMRTGGALVNLLAHFLLF